MSQPSIEAKYLPEIFSVTNLEDAKKIILTPEPGATTEERWEKETPCLVDMIGRLLQPDETTCLLDYGCGIGRLSKGLINRFNAGVIGVDFSVSMQQLAPGYVQSPRFFACSQQSLDMAVRKGFLADHAISVWVLQHCLHPAQDIARIRASIRPGGLFYVLNTHHRCVPTSKGWYDDGIDLKELLKTGFIEVASESLPVAATVEGLSERTFIKVLQKC